MRQMVYLKAKGAIEQTKIAFKHSSNWPKQTKVKDYTTRNTRQ